MMKKSYESQYIEALRNIYENGFADGVNERSLARQSQLTVLYKNTDFKIWKTK